MGLPGGGEILAILVVALIVFGPNRLPEIGRQIGKALHELRRMQDTMKRELKDAIDFPVDAHPDAVTARNYTNQGVTEQPALPTTSLPRFDAIEPPSSSFS